MELFLIAVFAVSSFILLWAVILLLLVDYAIKVQESEE